MYCMYNELTGRRARLSRLTLSTTDDALQHKREDTQKTTMNYSLIHVVLTLLLVELSLLFSGGILVLLVLGDHIVHVALGLSELHLVHTLTSIPVEEGLAAEHTREVLRDTLEHLLDRGGVTEEADRHLQALRRDVADGALNVV